MTKISVISIYLVSATTTFSEVGISILEASEVSPQPFEDPQEVHKSNTKVNATKEVINFFILK